MPIVGVFTGSDVIFKIGTKGRTSVETDMKEIEELESITISIDGTVVEWTSVTAKGWGNALMTGRKLTMDLKAKRSIGDLGNDYIATNAWNDPLDTLSKAEVEFPDGSKLEFKCVINVSNPGTAESTEVAALEFSVQSAGKPTYIPSV